MKTQSKIFVLENETNWETVGNGIDRQILGYDGQLMLVKCDLKKGQWEVCMNIFILSQRWLLVDNLSLL